MLSEESHIQETETSQLADKPDKPKMNKRPWLFVGLFALLAILIAGGYLIWKQHIRKTQQASPNVPGFSQKLTAAKPIPDSDHTVTKVIDPGGGVLSTTTSNGQRVTLTIPPDALAIPTEVSISPLKQVPINGYERADSGFGALVEPNDNFLSGPAYLTFDKPGDQAASSDPQWDRCIIGADGYDPSICAGIQKLPFGWGVVPGKVVLFSNDEGEGKLYEIPTSPIEDSTVTNTIIWRGGSYLPDQVNPKEAVQLADYTLNFGDTDYGRTTEVLAQLAALKVDPTPYKKYLKDLQTSSTSFPQYSVKSIMLADLFGEKQWATDTLGKMLSDIKTNTHYIRSSYLPWPSYYGTLVEIQAELKASHTQLSRGKVFAEGKKRSAPDAALASLQKASDELLAEQQAMAQAAREMLSKTELSSVEKVDAAELLQESGLADKTEEAYIKTILQDGLKEASSAHDAGHIGYVAAKLHFDSIARAAIDKRNVLAAKESKKCDQTHKTLNNFGNNACP